MPLIKVIRHGFVFWEAPRCANPPLPQLEDAPKEVIQYRAPEDQTPESIARRQMNRARRIAARNIIPMPAQIPTNIPGDIKIIQEAVMAKFAVTQEQLFSDARQVNIASARIASMGLCRELTQFSLGIIGRAHGKHHGTVVHARKRFLALRETDPQFRQIVESIRIGLLQIAA